MAIDYTNFESGRSWVALLPSTARTATPNQQQLDIKMTGVGGIIFFVNATVVAAGAGVTPKIEGIDPVTQAAYPILTAAGTAVINSTNAAGLYVYKVHPSAPSLTSGKVQHSQDIVAPLIRFTLTHGDAGSHTYSVTVMIDGD